MTRTLFPRVVDGEWCSQAAHSILDEMIRKGNRIAEVRKGELTHLEKLFKELAARIEQQNLQTLSLSRSPDDLVVINGSEQQFNTLSWDQQQHQQQQQQTEYGKRFPADITTDPETIDLSIVNPDAQQPDLNPDFPQETSDLDFLDNIGISSYEFLSIVDQIGGQDNFGILEDPTSQGLRE